jgi:hypothetical protein
MYCDRYTFRLFARIPVAKEDGVDHRVADHCNSLVRIKRGELRDASGVEGLSEEIEVFEVVVKGGADEGVRGRHACKCFAFRSSIGSCGEVVGCDFW